MPRLRLAATTWYKDSHSLYDYESTKITETKHDFDLAVKGINFYRKKNSNSSVTVGSEVLALDCRAPGSVEVEEFDFIGHFEVESLGAQRAKVNVLNVSTYKDKSKTTNTEKQKLAFMNNVVLFIICIKTSNIFLILNIVFQVDNDELN